MKNVIIYGGGSTGEKLFLQFQAEKEYHIICFADSSPSMQNKQKFNLSVVAPKQIPDYDFDYIVIATMTGWEEVTKMLVNDFNIQRDKIITKYVEISIEARITFLKNYAKLVYEKNMPGNVAEGGVFQGEFAKYINKYFFDRKLYLFDTFEGFDNRDKKKEASFFEEGELYKYKTNIQLVESKLLHKDNCIIKPGYFPESANDVDDEFVFVNLDFDLYNPTLSGLEFFYPKMIDGGVILVHDYFSELYKGVKSGVDYFLKEKGIKYMMPIGDGVSVAIIK